MAWSPSPHGALPLAQIKSLWGSGGTYYYIHKMRPRLGARKRWCKIYSGSRHHGSWSEWRLVRGSTVQTGMTSSVLVWDLYLVQPQSGLVFMSCTELMEIQPTSVRVGDPFAGEESSQRHQIILWSKGIQLCWSLCVEIAPSHHPTNKGLPGLLCQVWGPSYLTYTIGMCMT